MILAYCKIKIKEDFEIDPAFNYEIETLNLYHSINYEDPDMLNKHKLDLLFKGLSESCKVSYQNINNNVYFQQIF